MNVLRVIIIGFFLLGPSSNVLASDILLPKGVEGPQLKHKVEPLFPRELKSGDSAGTVEIEYEVAQDGRVKNLRVISSDDPRLSRVVADAVNQWLYEPATLPAGRTPLKVHHTFSFGQKPPQEANP